MCRACSQYGCDICAFQLRHQSEIILHGCSVFLRSQLHNGRCICASFCGHNGKCIIHIYDQLGPTSKAGCSGSQTFCPSFTLSETAVCLLVLFSLLVSFPLVTLSTSSYCNFSLQIFYLFFFWYTFLGHLI